MLKVSEAILRLQLQLQIEFAIIIEFVMYSSKEQWITVCPYFPQSLLASFPPLYSRPKGGYLES